MGESLVPLDAAGHQHFPVGSKARIVSLVPSLSELLFDLDLGRQLVGRTSSCSEPADQIKKVDVVGSSKAVDILTLAEMGPSHVLVNLDVTPAALIQEVIDLGVETIVTDCQAPEDNLALFDLIGEIFGSLEKAGVLKEELQREIAAARQAAAARPVRNVVYLTWKNPWVTVSSDTYAARMLSLAGLRTIGGDGAGRYPEVKIDSALLAQTDLVLFAADPFQFDDEDIEDFQMQYGVGTNLRLEIIDGRLVSWCGRRAAGGLRMLSRLADEL